MPYNITQDFRMMEVELHFTKIMNCFILILKGYIFSHHHNKCFICIAVD